MSPKCVCSWVLALCECRILDRWEIPSLFHEDFAQLKQSKIPELSETRTTSAEAHTHPRDIRGLDEVSGLMRRHIMGDEADRCMEPSCFKKLNSRKLLTFHFYPSFCFVLLFSFLMLRQFDTLVVTPWPIRQISIL